METSWSGIFSASSRSGLISKVDEPSSPPALPPPLSQLEATKTVQPNIRGNIQWAPLPCPGPRKPAAPVLPASALSQSPFVDRRPAPGNHVRTNPANQDNQPSVYKSKSVVRPLQSLSQYDDQTRPSNQNQSPFPKQYLPPLEQGANGNASFTDLSPPDDNITNYATRSLDANQASLTDSESLRVDNQPLFHANNVGVSIRPAQEYGEPSLVSTMQPAEYTLYLLPRFAGGTSF